MEKKVYITKEEQEKCRRVAEAFAELYGLENILVMDAGRYGFVKLQYYKEPQGFDDVITFTDSQSMFENLWQEWLDTIEQAHNLGIKSNATMLYGHVEKPEHVIDHLIKLRELQKKTHGFITFIPLKFSLEHTELEKEHHVK